MAEEVSLALKFTGPLEMNAINYRNGKSELVKQNWDHKFHDYWLYQPQMKFPSAQRTLQ